MGKIGCLFFLLLFLNGCDDGDVVVENISFENVATQFCTTNGLLYKIKEQESLILLVPVTTFTNEPTNVGEPIIVNVGGGNRVVYRFYNGAVSSGNICDIIPPATPNISEQWEATAGKIEITITANKKLNDDNGSSRITNYTNNIVFKDLTFAKPVGTQVYETFPFGDFTTVASNLSIVFSQNLLMCETNYIYAFSSTESLVISDIDPALLSTTNLGTTKVGLVSSNRNKINLRLYTNGVLTQDYFCKATLPVLPTVKEDWIAELGVEGVSGIIEVTSTTNGSNFLHKIVLKNIILAKGNSNFKLGREYVFGELITSN